MLPCLPQSDTDADVRAAAVAHERTRFQLSWDYGGLPAIKHVPLLEQPTPKYFALAARWEAESYGTIGWSEIKAGYVDPDGGVRSWLMRQKNRLRGEIQRKIWGPVRDVRVPSWQERDPLSIADYESMLPVTNKPQSLRLWRHDWWFAYQRVAGCNPVLLTQVTDRIPELVDPDPAIYSRLFPGDSPERALAEGRLFKVDLAMLEGITTSVSPDGYRKWLYPAIGLFVLPRDRGRLMPVCIRCDQRVAADSPLFYPTDGVAWMMARTVLQVADSNYHGVVEHGVNCHLMAAAIAVCLFRSVAPCHPLRILLHHHFQMTLAIGQLTLGLFEPGGRTPVIQSPDVDGTLKLAHWGYESHRWNERAPTRDFARRGVEASSVLPDYPARDDGLCEWRVLRRFVDRYVRLYYGADRDVGADHEVQAWVSACLSKTGAGLHDIGVDDRILTVDALVDFVAQIIYRVTTYHNVINYSVWDHMGFMPNMPMAQYAPAPRARTGHIEADLECMLPTREMTFRQFDDVFVVGNLRANRLGEYPLDYFCDRRVRPLVCDFASELRQIEHDIVELNKRRPAPYETLLPSRIAASIHI